MKLLSPSEYLWENFPVMTAELERVGVLDNVEELIDQYVEHFTEATVGKTL